MDIQNICFSPNPAESDIDPSLREVVQHGNLFFPVGIHYTDHSVKQKIMIYKHWHKEIEILYIAKNHMWLEVEHKCFLAKEGDIIFILPNHLHGAYQYQNYQCTYFAIVFDPCFIASYTDDLIQQLYIEPILKNQDFHFLHIDKSNSYFQHFKQTILSVIENFNGTYAHEILIKSKLIEFFYYFYLLYPQYNQYVQSKEEIVVSQRVKKIMLFIQEFYKSQINLNDISKHVNISREYFCRFFKKHFHLSFSEYLTQYRVDKAKQLLLNTNLPIIEIALETGYDNTSYFTKIFKRINGITPSQFRKKFKT